MQYRPALRMIAENYISIIGKNSSKNIKLDYFTAVEVSANLVLEKYQNIDTLSVKYEDAMKFIKTWNKEQRYQGLKMLIELAWEHEWKFANLEKQQKRTRIEHLLIESHNRDFQRVKNDTEDSRLARELEEEERAKENWADEESIESQLDALPLWEEELEVQEWEESSSISK